MESNTINNIINQILQIYKDKLSSNGNVASSQLKDTATFTTQWRGDYYEVYFILQDYWKYVESGTKPHFPPIDKIEEWIRVKKIVPTSLNGKVPSTSQLAYLISRSISRKGTKAYYPLKETLLDAEELINELAYEIVTSFDKEIEGEINEILG